MVIRQLLCIILLALPYSMSAQCNGNFLGSYYVTFEKPSSTELSEATKQTLDLIAQKMHTNPSFKVLIEGNKSYIKSQKKINEARVDLVVEYLVAKEVDWQRFLLKYEGTISFGQVNIRSGLWYDSPEWKSPKMRWQKN